MFSGRFCRGIHPKAASEMLRRVRIFCDFPGKCEAVDSSENLCKSLRSRKLRKTHTSGGQPISQKNRLFPNYSGRIVALLEFIS
jgi:hypothetical protein